MAECNKLKSLPFKGLIRHRRTTTANHARAIQRRRKVYESLLAYTMSVTVVVTAEKETPALRSPPLTPMRLSRMRYTGCRYALRRGSQLDCPCKQAGGWATASTVHQHSTNVSDSAAAAARTDGHPTIQFDALTRCAGRPLRKWRRSSAGSKHCPSSCVCSLQVAGVLRQPCVLIRRHPQ